MSQRTLPLKPSMEAFVHHLHEVEPVVDDLRLGDRLLRPRGVGLRHVHADVADLRPGAPDARREHLQRVGPLASRDAQHVARLRVADDGDELFRRPSPVEHLHLVHGYPPDLSEGDVPVLVREEALLHVLDGVPRDVEVLGYALYGHLRAALQDQLLQGLRDPGLGRREERERLVERLLAAMAPALVHAEPEERRVHQFRRAGRVCRMCEQRHAHDAVRRRSGDAVLQGGGGGAVGGALASVQEGMERRA